MIKRVFNIRHKSSLNSLKYLLLFYCLPAVCVSLNFQKTIKKEETAENWMSYGGNKAGNRYSALTQINRDNVTKLRIAWQYDATKKNEGTPPRRPMEIQCQPIVVNGILYGTTPTLNLFAIEADTGKELWTFDPFKNRPRKLHANRGVMYWEAGADKRILYTAGPQLFAINAETGKVVETFGQNGAVDLRQGISENLGRELSKISVDATSPGVIYHNILVIGSRVSEYGDAAPGHIRGFDVLTGKLKWVFHTIPLPAEKGYETWPKDAWKKIGGANNWAGMVLDEKRGAVYFGTGSPSVDFYGAQREGKNLYANCIISLNAQTGKLLWYYQTVHHDLWDRDISCQPNLVRVKHNGKMIDAVAQATKDGLLFVLNRDTGMPLFPVEERSAKAEYNLPGEHIWPTQPFPTKPAPFARQVFNESDITDLSPEATAFVKAKFAQSRSGNKYMPPSKEGTLYLGIGGGAEWGGNAADPDGILYQNSNEMVWDLKMLDYELQNHGETNSSSSLYMRNCAACHGADRKGNSQEYPSLLLIGTRISREDINTIIKSGRGRMPSFQHIADKEREAIINFLLDNETQTVASTDNHNATAAPEPEKKSNFPYIPPYINNGWRRFFDPNGYPAIKPPWGTLNAIDLNTGEYLWRVPLGEFPELTKKGIPVTGTENYGGPIVTAGGLVFIAATKDERIRAFDKKTGKVLWEFQLPAGGFATPITYQIKGKQYVVIAAGGAKNGHKPGGSYIAFTLP